LPKRIRVALIASLTIVSSLLASAPVGAVVTPQKVVIIVGPTGALTDNYRSKGDSIYATAVAAGATAVKVYSPNATWANVKAAVNGANIIVYLGHGNGFPNPYGTTELPDRHNGWGLNRTTTNGDGDNWSSTMVYCGEKVLRGLLTPSDDAARLTYCGGTANDGITPAPNWVMIYSNACYAPGASEGSDPQGPATESKAFQHVRNYSFPGLSIGAGAYFATDMHEGAQQLVDTILRNPGMAFGAIAENANGYDLYRQRHFAHPDLAGNRVWIQNSGEATSGDYFFAYAGKPALTPSGTTVAYSEPTPPAQPVPTVVGTYPVNGATGVSSAVHPAVAFDRVVMGVSASSFVLKRNGVAVAATVWNSGNSKLFTLLPAAALVAGTTYTLSVSAAITSVEGGALTPSSWTFTVAGTAPAPPPGTTAFSPAAQLVFKMGTHTGYQFSSTGAMTAVKSYTLPNDQNANTSLRTTVTNQAGTWFYIVNGVWAGYYVRQSSNVYLASAPIAPLSAATATFSPAQPLVFKMGTHTAYQFSSTGVMTAQKSYTLPNDQSANTTSRKTITNQSGTWFYIANGVWAGYWMRWSDVLYLKP